MPPQKIKLIQQGAEAKIFLDENKNQIIKDRISKSYRIKELDDKIRTRRTRSEYKLLEKASQIINVPIPTITNNFKEKDKIIMPFINGKKLSQHLEEFPPEKQKQILKQIGKDVAKLHDADIIHGDLTTSNMILVDDCEFSKQTNKHLQEKEVISLNSNQKASKKIKRGDINYSKEKEVISVGDKNYSPMGGRVGIPQDNFKIYFIDFGLGFFNGKFEDKAVDLHLLKQALEAKHFLHWQENYQSFLEGYKTSKNCEKTLNQLVKVEKRGRYRH